MNHARLCLGLIVFLLAGCRQQREPQVATHKPAELPARWQAPALPTDPLAGCSATREVARDWPPIPTVVCGAGPVRLAGAIELVARELVARHPPRREIAVHLVARNEGSTPARILSASCGGFSVRLYRSVTEIEREAAPVWENRLRTIRYGPEPTQVVVEECDFAAWSLDLPPGQTRARVATHVWLDRITSEVPPARYVVALGYRLAPDGPARLVRAGCVTLGSRPALSIDAPGCTEWSAGELRRVLAAEVARSERRRAEPPGPGASWFEFQVDAPARLINTSGSLRAVRYPPELRTAGVTDTVFVGFVVDSTGHVDAETPRVIHARYQASADAVQAAVGSWRYHPAMKDGVRVRHFVQVRVPVIPHSSTKLRP